MSRLAISHAAVAVTTAAVLLAGGAARGDSHPRASGGVIHACVSRATKAVRVVSGPCRPGERRLAWNKKGVRGPRGPRGAVGPTNRLTRHVGVPLGEHEVFLFEVPKATALTALGGTFGFTILLTDGTEVDTEHGTAKFMIQQGTILSSIDPTTQIGSSGLAPHLKVDNDAQLNLLIGLTFTVPSGLTPTKQYVDFSVDPDFPSPKVMPIP